MDAALMRPGRLDLVLYVPPPVHPMPRTLHPRALSTLRTSAPPRFRTTAPPHLRTSAPLHIITLHL
jgi:hypothetical protein